MVVITELAGWLPAIILPTATWLQLAKMLKTKKVEGINPWAWALFGLANLGTYIFTGKYLALQAILAFLLTAFLNGVIVVTYFMYKK